MITFDDFIKRMSSLNSEIAGNAMIIGVKSAQSLMSERIFQKGEAVNGSIGTYNSDDEIYVADKNLPRPGSATHKGKPNEKGKRKKIKTTYFESYQAMRSQQRREAGFVNLRLKNDLQTNFNNSPVAISNNEVVIGLSTENMNKARGNEEHFGKKIFSLNEEEKKELSKTVAFEIIRYIFK